jgi:hypothetical protein
MARIWEGISEEDILDVVMMIGGIDLIGNCLIDTVWFDGFVTEWFGAQELLQGLLLQEMLTIETNAYGNKHHRVWVEVGLNRDPKVHRHGWSIRVRNEVCIARLEVIEIFLDHQHLV